jgi:16S rRNA (adenine1518-N6/adenine1519-N6)-dimethyltransferase
VPASPLASPRATLAVLERHGLHTKKRLGQHFLVDDNVVGRTLALADLSGSETVLEVGPGIGTLTVALCDAAGAVVAVERDSDLAAALAETTAGCPRLAVVHADAVSVAADQIGAPFGAPVALVANLPYAVAATVVLRCFEELSEIRQVTVMVQAEVADRMMAVPGTKEYGSYTVKLQLRATPAGRFAVARSCFLPPPRVDSAVLRLERIDPPALPDLVRAACRVADAAFAQRRKTLRNSLRSALQLDADSLDRALLRSGIDGTVRAETLPPETFLALARELDI